MSATKKMTPGEKQAYDCRDWLKTLPNVVAPSAVKVTLGKETFWGARYAGDDCRIRHYLLGDLPKPIQRRKSTCFREPSGGSDWYIACYSTREAVAQAAFRQHHPFGQSFMLMEWDEKVCGGKIDAFDRYKYVRIPMTVEALD